MCDIVFSFVTLPLAHFSFEGEGGENCACCCVHVNGGRVPGGIPHRVQGSVRDWRVRPHPQHPFTSFHGAPATMLFMSWGPQHRAALYQRRYKARPSLPATTFFLFPHGMCLCIFTRPGRGSPRHNTVSRSAGCPCDIPTASCGWSELLTQKWACLGWNGGALHICLVLGWR